MKISMVNYGQKHIELLLIFLEGITNFCLDNDQITKLIFNFDDIKTVLEKENKSNIIKLLYLTRKTIHKILFEKEEIINIKFDNNKKSLPNNFYLNLLIKENPDIIDYSYSFDYIKEINNVRKTIKEKYKIILMAKCINDLIINFEGTDEYNEDEDKDKLESIKEENIMVIDKNLDAFKIIGLNYDKNGIERRKIEEIYLEAVIALIKEKKFEDYDYAYNILNQLEFKNIDITEKMFYELFTVLNKKEEYISDYLILKKDDLYDEKKVNFYFIMLNIILKNSIYFYQIPLFMEAKKIVLQFLKINIFNKLNISKRNKSFIVKFEYIIKTLSDSEYYWNVYLNNKYFELREILNYYKEYLFESKQEGIIIIEEKIKNNDNDFDEYLNDYDLAIKMNLRAPIINYLYNKKNNGIIKTEVKFNQEIANYNEMEKMILDLKIKKMNKKNKLILLNFFKDKNNKELLIKIFKQNAYEFFIKNAEQKTKIENIANENQNKDLINQPIKNNTY